MQERHCSLQNGETIVILCVDVGLVRKEHFRYVCVPILCSEIQWRFAVGGRRERFASGIDVGASGQQQFNDISVASVGCIVQRRPALFGLAVYLCSAIKKQLGHICMTMKSSVVQGRIPKYILQVEIGFVL